MVVTLALSSLLACGIRDCDHSEWVVVPMWAYLTSEGCLYSVYRFFNFNYRIACVPPDSAGLLGATPLKYTCYVIRWKICFTREAREALWTRSLLI
jgi:hypothetical protein